MPVGVEVAAFFLVVETLVMYLLNRATSGNACGIHYLLGIFNGVGRVGVRLAVTTSVAVALAFAYSCSWPPPFTWAQPVNLVLIATHTRAQHWLV